MCSCTPAENHFLLYLYTPFPSCPCPFPLQLQFHPNTFPSPSMFSPHHKTSVVTTIPIAHSLPVASHNPSQYPDEEGADLGKPLQPTSLRLRRCGQRGGVTTASARIPHRRRSGRTRRFSAASPVAETARWRPRSAGRPRTGPSRSGAWQERRSTISASPPRGTARGARSERPGWRSPAAHYVSTIRGAVRGVLLALRLGSRFSLDQSISSLPSSARRLMLGRYPARTSTSDDDQPAV